MTTECWRSATSSTMVVSTIGTELSPETISKITDAVLEEVLAWQRRPLEAFYFRDGGHVRDKAA